MIGRILIGGLLLRTSFNGFVLGEITHYVIALQNYSGAVQIYLARAFLYPYPHRSRMRALQIAADAVGGNASHRAAPIAEPAGAASEPIGKSKLSALCCPAFLVNPLVAAVVGGPS